MRITFLGTACMQPTKERNHPGVMVEHNGDYILFDCGENIQRQVRIAGLKSSKIRYLCISHWHGDHVLGIPGLLQNMSCSGFQGKLKIIGPKESKKRMSYMKKMFESKNMPDYEVIEAQRGVVIETETYSVSCLPLRHGIPTLGFRFEEKSKRRIDVKKAKKLHLSGPILGKIQKGISVEHEGRKIKPDDVSYIVKGKSMAYVSDTVACANIKKLGKHVDVLIMEATYGNDMEDKAKRYMHLTAEQSAKLAKDADAGVLYLTHFSQRYKEVNQLLAEAKTIFKNTKAARDFMVI